MSEEEPNEPAQDLIILQPIDEELQKSYLDYSMSVIVGRALPDVRDGLKPVHRRILYSMSELGARHNTAFKKSARIVGECFVKDTLVLTEAGLKSIQDIEKGERVYTQDGIEEVSELYIMPEKELLTVELENGIANTVTKSQKFKVLTDDWTFSWKEAKDLTEDDYIVTKSEYPGIRNEVQLDEGNLNDNVAYLLGQILSDGSVSTDYGNADRVCFHSSDEGVIAKIVVAMSEQFGYIPTVEEHIRPIETASEQLLMSTISHLRINRKTINKFFVQNFGLHGAKAHTKKFPPQIFQSPKHIIFSFLSGLFDGDGSVHKDRNTIYYGTVSKTMAQQLLILLQHFDIHGRMYVNEAGRDGGIVNGRKIESTREFYNIEFVGDSCHRLARELSLCHKEKKRRTKELLKNLLKKTQHEIIPHASKKLFEELSNYHIGSGWYRDTNGRKFRSGVKYPDGTKIRYSSDLHDKPLRFSQIIEWGIKEKLRRIGSELHEFLEKLMEQKVYFFRVKSVREAGSDVTYDIQVKNKHEFVANGMVSHNCLGKYHPHGDQSVYDALVRMAQDFSMRVPLVDGQGNFGSIDNDPAAHMRYTEARLAKIADELLQDIDKQTVRFVDNFDGSLKEPHVLPAKLPNLLVNGSSGIAVGMATNIPPHNLKEVAEATIAYIDNPDIDTFDLIKIMPGPDFPTGGIIQGKTGVMQYFNGGRGKLCVRAVITVEDKGKRQRLIISEIPYMVNKAALVKEIADGVKAKKIEGISDILDESDRKGMRVVVELKQGATAEVVENLLYAKTRCQTTFGVINVCLVNGKPKTLGIRDIIDQYVHHRRNMVRKRTEFDLRKALAKAHILRGLVIALTNIDPIVSFLKQTKALDDARAGLMKNYALSEKQANAILEMRLSRLTGLEQDKIRDELEQTMILIQELETILASEQRILQIIKDELNGLAETFTSERRTQIREGEITGIDMEDLIEPEDVVVTISNEGYCKRLPVQTYRAQRRGGKGIIGTTTKEEDFVRHLFIANTHTWLLIFTDKGKVYWTKVYNMPEASRQSKGRPIINVVNIASDEKVRAVIPVKEFSSDKQLFFVTKKGLCKKTVLSAYGNVRQSGIIALKLLPDDNLMDVLLTKEDDTILIASARGMSVKCAAADVRSMGRNSAGVRGIRLAPKDSVVDALVVKEGTTILTVTENGYGKRSRPEEYRLINRGGKGVRNIITSERNGEVVAVKPADESHDLMLMSMNGITIRAPASQVRIIGRNTQGVKLMNMKGDDKVVACALVDREEELEEPLDETTEAEPEEIPEEVPEDPTEDQMI